VIIKKRLITMNTRLCFSTKCYV